MDVHFNVPSEYIESLISLLIQPKSKSDWWDLLLDLCSLNEIEQLSSRAFVAGLIGEGKSYNEIIAETNVSSTTISRVAKSFKYGKGYSKFIPKENR